MTLIVFANGIAKDWEDQPALFDLHGHGMVIYDMYDFVSVTS